MINLILHTVVSFLTGFLFVRRLTGDALTRTVFSLVVGFTITTTLVYVLAVLLPGHSPDQSFLVSMIVLLPVLVFCFRCQAAPVIRPKPLTGIDFLAIVTAFLAAAYIMFKSFRQGPGSTLFVGSNEVFDFGHLLGIVRSFSYGSNIPYRSPFVAGAVDPYHFLFYFWAGLWERFGLPLVWAVNLPSVIGFAAFLITAYRMPAILFNLSSNIGYFTLALVLSHPTLTFFRYLLDEGVSSDLPGKIWHLSKYLYAAPYDGSDISIFQTLNVFTNQRHLAFALALAFILLFLAKAYLPHAGSSKSSVFLIFIGLISGALFGWHVVAGLIAVLTVTGIFIIRKNFRVAGFYLGGVIVCGWYFLLPWFQAAGIYIPAEISSSAVLTGAGWSFPELISSLVNNYGVYLVLVPTGLGQLPEQNRKMLFPVVLVFAAAGFVNFLVGLDILQKFFNYLTVFAGMLSALAVSKFVKSGLPGKAVAVISGIFLFGSGIVDLMVIKNDFAYPVTDAPDNRLIQAIKNQTLPDAVILSYADIFDPVVLAGRKNYWGFFKNRLVPDRSGTVREIYEATASSGFWLTKTAKIDYLLVPENKLPDFFYQIDNNYYQTTLPVVFKDKDHVLYKVE